MFCAFVFKIYMKKDKRFHIISPISATFYPPLHHKDKGSIHNAHVVCERALY